MKRPTTHSKPLAGLRPESYHPADYTNNQYAEDLNKYIDYLESKIENMDTKPASDDTYPKCIATGKCKTICWHCYNY